MVSDLRRMGAALLVPLATALATGLVPAQQAQRPAPKAKAKAKAEAKSRAGAKAEANAQASSPAKRSEPVAIDAKQFEQMIKAQWKRSGGAKYKPPPFRLGKGIIIPHLRRTPNAALAKPVIHGACGAALSKFDTESAKLYSTGDAATARRVLAAMERRLIDVRRELWKLETARKRQSASWFVCPTVNPAQFQFVAPFVIQRGRQLERVLVGGKLVAVTAGELLRGDYRKAVDALQAQRRALDRAIEPKAARKQLDLLERRLSDVRGALWLKAGRKR